jgi:hypothetical protein
MVKCEGCGAVFERRRSTGRFCSASCRARVWRGGLGTVSGAEITAYLASEPQEGVLAAVRRELEASGMADHLLAGMAMRLAAACDLTRDGRGLVSLSRELRNTMRAIDGHSVRG